MAREINSGKSALPITGSEATSSELTGGQATKVENGTVKQAFARKVVIENVQPEFDCGRFPIKRTIGERVEVTADIFADGHDVLYAILHHRPASRPDWEEVAMQPLENDSWQAEFRVEAEGRHLYTLQAWSDRFLTWSRDIVKKFEAKQDLSVDILVGVQLIEATAQRASRKDRGFLATRTEEIKGLAVRDMPGAVKMALSPEVQALMIQMADRRRATTYSRELAVVVDREKARFSAWYEMFPRSCSIQPGERERCRTAPIDWITSRPWGSTLSICRPFTPLAAPIARERTTLKKQRQKMLAVHGQLARAKAGTKRSIRELGTLEEFKSVAVTSQAIGPRSSSRPGVPERARPSLCEGAQGMVPPAPGRLRAICGESAQEISGHLSDRLRNRGNQALWEELKSVVLYWIAQGVRIFRVDNPHTKPFDSGSG